MAKLSSNPKERTEVPAQTTPLWGIALQLEDASASLAYHTMPHPVSATTKTKKFDSIYLINSDRTLVIVAGIILSVFKRGEHISKQRSGLPKKVHTGSRLENF